MTFSGLEEFVKVALREDNTGHDFGHIKRVCNLALRIAETEENVDLKVLRVAALLHDIAFTRGFFSGEHGDVSEDLAKPLLPKLGLTKMQEEKILQAIRLHNYWFHKEKDVPIETKILRDADRLEMIGYIGIIREVVYCSNSRKDMFQGLKDLSKIEGDFETKTGERLSKERLEVVKEFIANLEKESSI